MKSQENRLENDFASLEKRLREDNYRKQKRIKYWTSWPLGNYKEKKCLFTKQKARLYDLNPVGTTRGKKYTVFPKS